MKILLTTEFSIDFVCGITTAILNQKKVLEELNHEVRILTINDSNISEFKDGIYLLRKNLPKFYKDSNATTAFFDSIIDSICEWKPDIVHAHNEFFTFVVAKKISRKLKCPLILTCHTDYPAYGIHFVKDLKFWNKLLKKTIPKIISPANAVLCSSGKIINLLESYDISNTILNIKLGIDLTTFKQTLDSKVKNELKNKYGIKSNDFVFVSVCRLSKEKSVGTCIEVFEEIYKKHNNVKFLIVGSGSEQKTLKDLVKFKNLEECIIFTGQIKSETIWKYYQLGDVFINASESETQGLTFIEALASSLPIVCKRDMVIRNFLVEGENGYSWIDLQDFKDKCEILVENSDLYRKIKENCSNSVESFDLLKYGQNLEDLFNIAVAEGWQVDQKISKDSLAIKKFGEF